ncbi:uncharacterized protein DCS_07690 [Drechmeria coniospora]|uniref:Uncharacterized protein n=1 Tax=Drechmeria coniospora TaxID=98403 RepID=A0A151GF75_DRECN|nr:uncharacterized protein DCS_07690 [Drechmeria coniospora]KYK55726.1 uncharacterized protein DCS_07690 [Drechmeria coniospora]ODA81675.1 hypothetical protein RJ55_00177 [Drechmeria coniospora]
MHRCTSSKLVAFNTGQSRIRLSGHLVRAPKLLSQVQVSFGSPAVASRHLHDVRRRRGFCTSAPFGSKDMASDEDYMSFLDKANKDLDDGLHMSRQQQNTAKAQFHAVDSDVPKAIQDVCKNEVYVSEADEPFQEVSLRWTGGDLPDEVEFATLIHHHDPEKAEIEIMDPLDWDSTGQYSKVIEAVREASRGNDVRVYRVVRDKTRVEYWLITREQGKIVGVKALGVES